MNISVYIALVSLWRHSNKGKNQDDARIMRALELAKQNNRLTIAFSTDLCGRMMLQAIRDFIRNNSNSSPKIIHVVVNNIRQVKDFTRIIMANNL